MHSLRIQSSAKMAAKITRTIPYYHPHEESTENLPLAKQKLELIYITKKELN